MEQNQGHCLIVEFSLRLYRPVSKVDHDKSRVEPSEGAIVARVRNAIVLIGVIAAFGLFAAKPFFPPGWHELAGALATLVFAAAFLLILLLNKLVCGVYFPRRQGAAQHRALGPRPTRTDLFPHLMWLAVYLGVGLLTVYGLKQFSLSRHELYVAALVAPLIAVAIFNIYLRYRRRSS
jgi:hypothetical protein